MLWERIEAGALTGTALAAKAGFRQGYISNFLNRKRGLSLAGMDRILEAEGLSVLDLLGMIPDDPEHEKVPRLAAEHVSEAQLAPFAVESVKLRRSLLQALQPSVLGDRWKWDRFLLMQPDDEDIEAMHPKLTARCMVLVDRHYNSLEPYRRGERGMFVVIRQEGAAIRYASASPGELVLRSESPRFPAETIPIPAGREFHEFVIGRVAYVMGEV